MARERQEISVKSAEIVLEALLEFLRVTSRAATRENLLGKQELTSNERHILDALAAHGPLRSTLLASHQDVDPSTITSQVHCLESRGLVSRYRDPADGRAFLLHVTPAGTECLAKARQNGQKVLMQLMDDWSNQECRDLYKLMHKLTLSLSSSME